MIRISNWRIILLMGLFLHLFSMVFGASRTIYSDSTLFHSLFQPGDFIRDDYSQGLGYPAGFHILTNAEMTAILGETEYFTTGFDNWNILNNNIYYCAGCNGSYRLTFTNTSVSTAGLGVEAVGVNIRANEVNLPYLAFVTYGDGSTENIPLPAGHSFFGLTSPDLITSIHFGLINGQASQNGYFEVSLLTIGRSPSVPVPTLSEWGFIILLLLIIITFVVINTAVTHHRPTDKKLDLA